MGFLWVTGFSFFHSVASPFHSFVITSTRADAFLHCVASPFHSFVTTSTRTAIPPPLVYSEVHHHCLELNSLFSSRVSMLVMPARDVPLRTAAGSSCEVPRGYRDVATGYTDYHANTK